MYLGLLKDEFFDEKLFVRERRTCTSSTQKAVIYFWSRQNRHPGKASGAKKKYIYI